MEESERSSFTFYLSFEKAISKLDDTSQLAVYRAISRYSLFGEIPKVDGLAAIAWELIKPILDKSRIRSINGAKAKGKSKPNLIGNQNAVLKNEAKTKLNQSKNEAKTKQDRDRYRDEDKDRINIETKVSKCSDKSIRFVPPTLKEVQDYISQNNYSVEASIFVDFYTSKGWMVGSNKMKDWKAAVRTWQRKEKKQRPEEVGIVLKDNSTDKFKNDKLW